MGNTLNNQWAINENFELTEEQIIFIDYGFLNKKKN